MRLTKRDNALLNSEICASLTASVFLYELPCDILHQVCPITSSNQILKMELDVAHHPQLRM